MVADMNGMHSADRVLHELRTACDEAGSQSAWAEAKAVSPAYVSDVLAKRREPGEAILSALGYERVVLYRRVK